MIDNIKFKPIGIFDSGIGGLTVLKKLQNQLPNEHFVYFADTARLPYGEKTPEQIIGYARQTLTWMQQEIGAKLVVAACHTSSATALDRVAPEFSIPVIGTIHPMVEAILKDYSKARMGIIATPTSVESRMHETSLLKAGFQGDICSISCPRFVPLIEDGHIFGPELSRKAVEYLSIFKNKGLDTLVYGCTHYPWIAEIIQKVLPPTINYIDPADYITAKVAQELYHKKIMNISPQSKKIDFYCSSLPEKLSAQVSLLLGTLKPPVALKTFAQDVPPLEKRAVNE